MEAPQGGSTKRLDALRDIENKVQEKWLEGKSFEVEAEPKKSTDEEEKFFVTFPFPYMNGRLHLGHAFSLTKAEFSARYQRLLGKNVLWPFAFHCTGMPIAACADKLKHELEDAAAGVDLSIRAENEAEADAEASVKDPKGFASKKSKAVAKTGNAKTQFDILKSLGIADEEIPKFADAAHWLEYFPPLGKSDLMDFGLSVDWRRSFITTDANPYFDKFVQWQFRLLLARDKVKFGLRPSIFSTSTKQPCADHDRASGEGANPQEYTLIKIKVNSPRAEWTEKYPALKNKNIYLVAATLRPETMYGQTNCFVLPTGEYGFYPALSKVVTPEEMTESGEFVAHKKMSKEQVESDLSDVFVCSERSALNMCHQGILPIHVDAAEPHLIGTVVGQDLIGLSLKAPYSVYDEVFALPLPSIKMDKGTGVVTSVPSDSADDYTMLRDLRQKEVIRKAYNVELAWCEKDPVEIIDVPGCGRLSAVDACEKRKVQSWKDEAKLKEIKAELYLKSFYEGVMVTGKYEGQLVKDAKGLVKADMIAEGLAVNYLEPEKKVVARSGDECIVALCNQWYSDFGNAEWTEKVLAHVSDPAKFNAYGQKAAYERTVQWLQGWACSRNYGLGTLLPWERENGNHVLIESLSDSTIYFAYYTLAHFYQGDIYGQKPGLLGVSAEELNDDFFNYVYCQTEELPKDCKIPADTLKQLRAAFEYWYPMNLRCSGKDLIQNHLTMSLFTHAAIWPERPDLWPRGFYTNGHLQLDSEKMSKSTGNFLTLEEAIRFYSADATRVALADAGDSVDDANFERQTAVSALMRLYVLLQFVEEIVEKKEKLREGDKTELDLMFENMMWELVTKAKESYDSMIMRDALKFSFFEMLSLKDTYRNMLPADQEFHKDTIYLWIETLSTVLSPIAPHICDHISTSLLNKTGSATRWPTNVPASDTSLKTKWTLLLDVTDNARKTMEKSQGKKKTGPAPTALAISVAEHYPKERQVVLQYLKDNVTFDSSNKPQDPKWLEGLKNHPSLAEVATNKKQMSELLGFASFRVKAAEAETPQVALMLSLPFDECEFLRGHTEFIARNLGLEIVSVNPAMQDDGAALPAKPSFKFSAEASKQ